MKRLMNKILILSLAVVFIVIVFSLEVEAGSAWKYVWDNTSITIPVGESFDKVARVMKLPYPGGPIIDKLTLEGNDTYDLPTPLDDDSYNFSFSGLKSAVINLTHNEEQRGHTINMADLACSFQSRVVGILSKKSMRALKEYNVNNFIIAGGVAANKILRNRIKELGGENNINFTIPDLKYCTDNATMIGAAGYFAYMKGRRSDIDLSAKANVPLS